MKVGFFGNTNNYPFILARAMRELGHDVTFIIDRPEPLHRPEHRYADVPYPYPPWITDLSPVRVPHYAVPNARISRVRSILAGCDAVVLNGLGASVLPRLRKPGIVMLTGSDLVFFANYRSLLSPPRINAPDLGRASRFLRSQLVRVSAAPIIPAQRAAIRMAEGVNYFPRGVIPEADALLDEIGLRPERRMFFMMMDVAVGAYQPPPPREVIRTFCATRLNWVRPIPPGFHELDYKGSDVMIRGIALFTRRTGRRLDVRLVRKGLHVRETEVLVRESGIADQVTWLDEMDQASVTREFREADVAFEQFGDSIIGMAGLEAMALGRPLVTNWRHEIMDGALGERAPVCQARTPEEVAERLAELVDPQARQQIGQASRDFALRVFAPRRAAEGCLARLGAPVH